MRESLASLVDDFRGHAAETAVVSHRGVRRYATTYGELAELAGRFAAELERRGIAAGDRVVLWGASSAEWIGVFFGCLLRGVIVVPLDAAGDAVFAARVVKDVAAKLVVADTHLLAALPVSTASIQATPLSQTTNEQQTTNNLDALELPGIAAHLPAEPLWTVSAAVTLDTPFQIVFTSGTTSEPRGIVHTHRNVLVTLDPIEREMAKYRRAERLFHPLRFLHSLPLSHVFGQFMGLWCPALLAAQVHFAEQMEPARMVDLIKRERISVLVAVPRVLQLLRGHLMTRFKVPRSEPEQEYGQQKRLSVGYGGMRGMLKKWWKWRRVHRALGWKFWAVISGGATLPAELEAFWMELGLALIQGYGMTETAALVTLNHPFHIAPGTIGKPLPGREVKIGDDGEILVRGPMLAPAVWEHGTMQQREGEWLATGDLAEQIAGGELRFAGRKSDVIVTGAGMNVHPADLEKVLAAQAAVRACVVVGCQFASGPEAVAVVLSAALDDELAAAVQKANAGLADYQQIRHWLRWPQLTFPYTSTGKLIRREVARWACEQATGNRGQGTETLREDALMETIAGVTGEAAPSGDADALRLSEDLKLDSLGRVQLQTALEQRFDVELEDDALATVETVASLRALIEAAMPHSNTQPQRAASVTPNVSSAPSPPPTNNQPPLATNNQQPTTEDLYPRWPWWCCVRWIRIAWIEILMRPLVWLLAKPRVVTGNLQPVTRNSHEPVLIVCNHVTAWDGALVLYALPRHLRRRVACAMSGEMLMDFRHMRGQGNWALDFLAPVAWLLLTALFNVFPLPRARGFRRSFAHAGAAMDRGYSVLIFPEGSRSRDGKLHAFRPGIGLLAKETGAAVLPVALRGLYDPAKRWFHAGKVEVRLGPLIPPADETTDAAEIAERVQRAVAELVANNQ